MNRPLVFITPVFMLGILFSSLAGLHPAAALVFLAAAVAAYYILKKDIVVFIMYFFMGAACFSMTNNFAPPNHIKNLETGAVISVKGVISEMPRESEDRIYFVVETESIREKDRIINNVAGKVRVSAEKKTGKIFRYGEVVEITGRLKKPDAPLNYGEFDYGRFLSNRGISFIMYVRDYNIRATGEIKGNPFVIWSLKIKDGLLKTIYASVPHREAKILDGIMLGNQRVIPPDIYDKFKITGTVHILAVSGMNVGLIALFIFLILKLFRVKRKIAAAITMLFTAVFAIITGADPSIVRAAIMAWIVLAAMIIEKDPDILNSLAAAALLILFFRPSDLFEASFQLSFLATFGLIYLTDRMKKYFEPLPDALGIILATTITAQLFLIPVLANTFNQVSLMSVIANIFIVPLSSIITILGFVMWACGFFSADLSKLFGAPIWALIKIMTAVIDVLARVPYAAVSVKNLPVFYTAFYYLFFLALPHKDIDIKIRNASVKAASGVLLIVLTVIHFAVPLKTGVFYVLTGRDVNSVFIHTKSNKKILFLGCDNYRNDFGVRSKVIPFLRAKGINNIDYFIGYALKNPENIKNIKRNFRVINEIDAGENMNLAADKKNVLYIDPLKTEVSGGKNSFIFTKLLTSSVADEKGKIIYPCFYSRENLLKAAEHNKVYINSMNRIRPLKIEHENIFDTVKTGMIKGEF